MTIDEAVQRLQGFHDWYLDNLTQHRLLMSPSTVYLIEQTVKSLEELKQVKEERSDY